MLKKNKFILILIISILISNCGKNKNEYFHFYSGKESLKVSEFALYKSYGNPSSLFVSIQNKEEYKSFFQKPMDSILYHSNDTIVKMCRIKSFWKDKYCDFAYGVNNDETLKIFYNKEKTEFYFYIGPTQKINFLTKNKIINEFDKPEGWPEEK